MKKNGFKNLEPEIIYEGLKILFLKHFKLLEFLFDSKKIDLNFPISTIREELPCFSQGEQALILIALEVWIQKGNLKKRKYFNDLDCRNLNQLFLMMKFLKQKQEVGSEI